MKRRHLRLASRALRKLAWLNLCLGLLGSAVPLAAAGLGQRLGDPSAPVAGIVGSVILLALTMIWFAVLFGAAEGIRMLLDVESQLAELENRQGDGG